MPEEKAPSSGPSCQHRRCIFAPASRRIFAPTLTLLGPRPGPSAAILAETFRLTPSEAKVACIIARGAPPDIAARELKVSRETARNQLKAVFAKTDTHRQSELVALLLQVE
jgi:DNA-binding CsgD family transcriptional regulator